MSPDARNVCGVPDCTSETDALLPRGWRCDVHRPPIPTPDPALTLAGLATRDFAVMFPKPRPYGRSRSDPLGRDDWPISKTTRLPVRPAT